MLAFYQERWINQKILQVSGKDAFRFLQGQLSCDMRDISAQWHLGALCNQQGRVIANFEISRVQGQQAPQSPEAPAYWIKLPTSMTAIFLRALEKYAQFSAVTFTETQINVPVMDLASQIRQKKAVILPETTEKFTPQVLDYFSLNRVSLRKGCYKGQEIIARMYYLGKLKKQLYYIKTIINPASDLENTEDTNNTGNIVNRLKTADNIVEMLIVK